MILWLTMAALMTVALIPARAQQPKFEIADIHNSTTLRTFALSFGGVVLDGLYINRDATMLDLIKDAYSVSDDDVAGGPGWISYDLFDIVAKVRAGTTGATANLMLRSLLSDRFGLVVRRETRPVPRYFLTVGTKGSKLKPGNPSDTPACKKTLNPPGPVPADLAARPNIVLACHNLTGAGIAENLRAMVGDYVDHDAVDATKLEESWDFELEYTPRESLAAKGADGKSLFDAVETQLGLKLELQNIPTPSLAVERVNRKPTPNPDGIAAKLSLASARFEVASVKPANPDGKPFEGFLYAGSQIHAGGTLRTLIARALQVTPNVASDVVIGLPRSADSQYWDIMGKMPSSGEGAFNMMRGHLAPPPLSVALEMLRGVLLDQFEMKTHTETREATVYAMRVANGKLKITKAGDSERAGCRRDPNAPRPFTNLSLMVACKNTSMADLADTLERMADAYIEHPVVDATGLDGGFDFTFGWTAKALMQPVPQADDGPGGQAGRASDPNGITVFDAMERELGLRLVKQKRTIPVIVVDHVDEKPIE
jgi:uncharacterized protein (TIGR03435 family)